MVKIIVDWDTDGELIEDLPTIVEYPEDKIDEEEVSDWLSNKYGFCINNWYYAD